MSHQPMTFDDVRRYLATRDVNDPLLGSTPLSAVRTGIQENEADFERLKGHLKARRAKEKAEEMRVLAGKQKAAVEEKNMQMAALTEFRLAKEAARMREVKAGLERERVLRSLKGVNEERLEELSVERTKELRVIENERQQLIERERELDVVVKKVEDDLSKQESRMRDRVEKMEKEMAKGVNKGHDNLTDGVVRERIAQSYGTAMATIKIEQQSIMEEKLKLDAMQEEIDKSKSSSGDPNTNTTDDASMKDLLPSNSTKKQESRIKQLTRQLAEEEAEHADFFADVANTAKRMQEKYPLPKDTDEILDSFINDPKGVLSIDEVPISPSRAKQTVVYRDAPALPPAAVPPSAALLSAVTFDDPVDDASHSSAPELDELDQLQQAQEKKQQNTQRRASSQPQPAPDIHREIAELRGAANLEPNLSKRNEMLYEIDQMEAQVNGMPHQYQQQQNPAQPQFQPRMGQYAKQEYEPAPQQYEQYQPPPPVPLPQHGTFSNQNDSAMMMMMMMQQQQQQQQQQQNEARAREQAAQQQQQMQMYMTMMQQQTQQLEQQNESLQNELLQVQELATSTSFSAGMLSGNAGNIGANNNSQQQQASQQQHPMEPQHSESNDVLLQQIANSGSAESKRLERLRIEHVEQMEKLRFEAERLEKEAEINAIKEKLKQEKDRSAQAAEHEAYKAKQKRQIEKMRMQRAVIREAPIPTLETGGDQKTHQQRMDLPYSIENGFRLTWDYAINLPRRAQRNHFVRARLVYVMYNGTREYSKLRSSKWFDAEPGVKSMSTVEFGMPKTFDMITPLPDLKMVMEMQFTPTKDSMSKEDIKPLALGWFAIPLFKGADEIYLNTGNFKVPIRMGGFTQPALLSGYDNDLEKQKSDEEIGEKPTIFFRVRHSSEKIEALAWTPDASQHLYKYPFEEQEEAAKAVKEKKKRKEKREIKQQQSQELDEQAEDSPLVGDEEEEEEEEKIPSVPPSEDEEEEEKAPSAPPSETPTATHNVGVQIHKLDVLPHPKNPARDMLGNVSVSVETVLTDGGKGAAIFSTKAAKPKTSASDSVFYKYKNNSSFSVTTSDNLLELKLTCKGEGFNFEGRMKLLDDRNQPTHGEQQIQLFAENESGEPFALLLVSIDDSLGEADKASHSSKRSRQSGGNRKGGKRADVPPSVHEEEEGLGEFDELSVGSGEDKGEEPFIEAEEKASLEDFDTSDGGDGIDVYVDGCRSLPDNVNVTRVVVKCLTKSGVAVGGEPEEGFSEVTGTRYYPKYSTRKEYRSEHFDPTSTLMIRVDTYNPTTKKVLCVGYTLLPLFCQKNKRNTQPEDANSQEFSLNNGMFQIPLYKVQPPDLKNLTGTSYEDAGSSRVTCGTVLLRIVKAPKDATGLSVLSRSNFDEAEWEGKGLTVPAKEYSEGVYDSRRANPAGVEDTLYELRRERQDMPLGEFVKQQIHSLDDSKDVSSIENADVDKHVKECFASGNPKNMIDYTFMTRFNESSGFKFCVDGLHRMTGGGMFSAAPFFKAIYTQCPPSDFYKEPPMTGSVNFTRSYDVDSDQLAPRFKDEFVKYNTENEKEGMCMIVEIRTIAIKKRSKVVSEQDTGLWTALPVFRPEAGSAASYVDSGCFCLPVFEGKVPAAALDASDIYEWICATLKSGKKKKDGGLELKHGASVIVRLVDSCVEEFGSRATKSKDVNMKYVGRVCDAARKADLIYDYDASSQGVTKKPVSKLFGKSDQDKELMDLNWAMVKSAKIDHYNGIVDPYAK